MQPDRINPRRSSWSPGEATDPLQATPRNGGGFYIPPPGYHARSSQKDRPTGDKQTRTDAPNYGGHGEWKPLHGNDGGWVPIIRNEHRMQDVFSRLVHSDWNIPQAQRVLSTWATLATLLAGTQTTLLTFYERDKTSTYIALSFAALFLEIYGALLASINIMISISLQASQASQDARQTGGSDTQKAEADLRISQGFKWQWMGPATSSDLPVSTPARSDVPRQGTNDNSERQNQRATTIALCILDRLTVSCGYIIPVGGMLQLTGLTIYAVQTHPGPAVYSLVGAILFAASMTLFGLGQGVYAGNNIYLRAQAVMSKPPCQERKDTNLPNLPHKDRHSAADDTKSSSSSRSSRAGIRRPDYDLDDDEDLYDQHGSAQRLMSGAVLNAVVIA